MKLEKFTAAPDRAPAALVRSLGACLLFGVIAWVALYLALV